MPALVISATGNPVARDRYHVVCAYPDQGPVVYHQRKIRAEPLIATLLFRRRCLQVTQAAVLENVNDDS